MANPLKNMDSYSLVHNPEIVVVGGLESQNLYAIPYLTSDKVVIKAKRDEQFRKKIYHKLKRTEKPHGRLG